MNKQDILIRLLKEDKISKEEFLCFWDAMGLTQVTENKDPKYYHPSNEGTVTTSPNGDKIWTDNLFVEKDSVPENRPSKLENLYYEWKKQSPEERRKNQSETIDKLLDALK